MKIQRRWLKKKEKGDLESFSRALRLLVARSAVGWQHEYLIAE